jgi:hypothetical protein
MENLIGKYIISTWKHNEGFQQNWLRRINRQTKTQYVSDVQWTLLLSDKYKKLYDADSDFFYKRFNRCAFRCRFAKGKFIPQKSYLSNSDGVDILNLVEDFSTLKCEYEYSHLFENDIRNILPSDSKKLKEFKDTWDYFEEKELNNNTEDKFYVFNTYKTKEDDTVAAHLRELFGDVEVLKVSEAIHSIDTIHEKSIYSNTAIHYHINFHGGEKEIRSRQENYHNTTISFWFFGDRIVYKYNSGIASW